MTLGETGQRKPPEVILKDTVFQMRKVLKSPLLPNFVPPVMNRFLDRTRLLSDQDFEAKVLETADDMGMELYRIQAIEQAKSSNGAFIPWDKIIVIRKSYVENNPGAEYSLFDLLAEELGHAFKQNSKLPLSKVNDGSLLIYPFLTREELIADLNEKKVQFLNQEPDLGINDIELQIEGFAAGCFEKRTGRKFPKYMAQGILEETRSAIIQTVLELIRSGATLRPQGRPEEQFAAAMQAFLFNTYQQPELLKREAGVINFLAISKMRAGSAKNLLARIMPGLYQKNSDQFTAGLNDQEYAAFFQGTRGIDQEFRHRPIS